MFKSLVGFTLRNVCAFNKNNPGRILYNRSYSNSTHKSNQDRYTVHVIPALSDNYMYVLTDKLLKFGIAIDPVEPVKVMKVIEAEKLELKAVLTTHHHFDHAGGNELISQMVKDLPIYGFDERIDALTSKVSHNETLKIGDLLIKCLHTPCHTSGHVCYFIDDDFTPICFTGDTLFVAGCGKFFEGSGEDMLKSLNILSALPPNTKCYCGHEYTLSNLKFALSIEPNNAETLKKLKMVEEKLKNSVPSVPTTIGEELSYNPFLRVHQTTVQQSTNQVSHVETMSALRKLKDNFKSKL